MNLTISAPYINLPISMLFRILRILSVLTAPDIFLSVCLSKMCRSYHRLIYFNFDVFTQLSIPTHAQLQRHRLKLIKKPSKKSPTCFGLRPSSGSYNVLAKITII